MQTEFREIKKNNLSSLEGAIGCAYGHRPELQIPGKIRVNITGGSSYLEIPQEWLFSNPTKCPDNSSQAYAFVLSRIDAFQRKLQYEFAMNGWEGIKKIIGEYEKQNISQKGENYVSIAEVMVLSKLSSGIQNLIDDIK